MMRCITILLILFITVSCSDISDTKQVSSDLKTDLNEEKINRSTELLPEPDILERLKGQKSQIDTLAARKELKFEVLVKEPNKEKLTIVINQQWPEIVETTFNIWRNSEGQIKRIGEYPFSESGDWNIGYEHYFDKNGKTFSFERNTNFFNSICTDGVAYEKIIEFYNSDFNRLDRIYSLTDKGKQELKKEDCVMNYDYPYDVSNNLENYIKRINYGS